MSERVVDVLEMIEVHVKYGETLAGPARQGNGRRQRFDEHAAVGKARQKIVTGQPVDLLLDPLALGHIDSDDQQIGMSFARDSPAGELNDSRFTVFRVDGSFERSHAAGKPLAYFCARRVALA